MMPGQQPHNPAEDRVPLTSDLDVLCEQIATESIERPIPIAKWLEKAPGDSRHRLFRKLLATELARRWKSGETPLPDEYRRQFPEYADEVELEFDQLSDPAQKESRSVSMDTTVTQRGGQPPIDEESGWQPGDVIGRYRLQQRVGGGGFGIVWRAFDPELDRCVAIKLARPDLAFSSTLLEQTRDEARKAAAMTHRGIVPVYDVVPCEGSLGIVSEFISGQTLTERIRSGRIPQDESIDIVIQIAQALHHAHKRGLIHRDVKPGNILLKNSGDAVLTDFGLAISEAELLHEPQGSVGTRKYMSPEQARGESHLVDARSDVFSLGVVLYRLVTGRLPWIATTPNEYVEQLLNRDPRPLRTIDDSIDPDLERICLRCLEKPANSRYSTADDLVKALTALKTRLTATEPAPARWKATLQWLSVATLVLVAAVIGPKVFGPDPQPPPPRSGDLTGSIDGSMNNLTADDQPALLRPDSFEWQSMLEKPPIIVAYPPGDGREKPHFDAELKLYSVHAERMQWIAQTAETNGEWFEVRAVIHVDGWVGQGGIVWGLRDDLEAFPDKQKRCFCVEYMRVDDQTPAKLWVSELFLSQYAFDDWRVTQSRTIDTLDVAVPEKFEVAVRILVKKDEAIVKWGDGEGWAPHSPLRDVNWLPAGTTGIGMSGGFSKKTQLTDFSLRYLSHEP